MTDPDQTRIDAIQAREQAATKGPWNATATLDEHETPVFYSQAPEHHGESLFEADWGTQADADFCAHAREDIPYLLAALARLQAEKDYAWEALNGERARCQSTYKAQAEQVARLQAENTELQTTNDALSRIGQPDADPPPQHASTNEKD